MTWISPSNNSISVGYLNITSLVEYVSHGTGMAAHGGVVLQANLAIGARD